MFIIVIKWVLREDFVGAEDRYCVNTKIYLCFIASLLDIGIDGKLITHLTEAIFHETYLCRLDEVICFVMPLEGLPMDSDLRRFVDLNERVQWHPFVFGFNTMT